MKKYRHKYKLHSGSVSRLRNGRHTDCDGNVYYVRHGQLHCVTGPAEIRVSGYKGWMQKGLYHRKDGPAMIYPNGSHHWYWKGFQYENIDEWAKAAGIFDTPKFVMLKMQYG